MKKKLNQLVIITQANPSMMHKSYIFVNIYITHIKTINNLIVQVYDTNQIWLHLNFLTIVQGNKTSSQ
jgi:hypothetical protein